jgi:hypothetical protein
MCLLKQFFFLKHVVSPVTLQMRIWRLDLRLSEAGSRDSYSGHVYSEASCIRRDSAAGISSS